MSLTNQAYGRFDLTAENSISKSLIMLFGHVLVWCFLPLFYIHNLHSDTTELIYWGHALSWGYPKHPPLAAWLLETLVVPGENSLVVLFLFSQLCVALAAIYLWSTLGLFRKSSQNYLGVLFFLAAPTAGLFALQINHNSILQSFWIAFTFHSLRYFKEGRNSDALLMFLIAALGFLVKYQIVLLFLTILMLSLTVKSYRFIFRRSATYIGLFLFVIVISPHIFWLVTNDNSAVEYALSARRATGALELFLSLNDLLVGFLTICVSAILVIGAARLLRFDISFNNPSFEVMILAIGPIFFLVIGAFVTGQDIRQGWMLPMTTTVVLGIALCVEIKFKDLRASHLLFTTLGVAALNNALLFGFIEVKAAMGKPIEAFDFDAKPIAERVDALWREISSKPLHCIVVDSRRSSHVVLWLPSRPKVINVGDPYWSTPRQIKDCLADGGIAVLHENTEQVNAQRFCLKKEVETSASSAINKQALFPQLDLFYVSTRGEGGQCGE